MRTRILGAAAALGALASLAGFPLPAPAATGDGLLENGGFEQGLDGWTFRGNPSTGKAAVDERVRAAGKRAARISKTDRMPPHHLSWTMDDPPAGKRLAVSLLLRGKDLGNAWVKFWVTDAKGDLFDLPANLHESMLRGTFDWKRLEGEFDVPEGATRVELTLMLVLQGEAWMDDVRVVDTGKKAAPPPAPAKAEESPADPAVGDPDVPTRDLRAGGNDRARFLLHGPLDGAKAPGRGYRLAVILPGGTGSEEFAPFVRNILRHALGKEYVVAQPVSVKWRKDQEIVWPTKRNPVPGMDFTTEEFVEDAIAETMKRVKIDPRHVFTLTWSSSGPAAYAVALQDRTRVTGSYVSMSVFFPDHLPSLKNGKGRPFYIEHSPEDTVCLFRYAEEARDALKEAGADVEFSTYPGGHGWVGGPIFPRIRKGFDWLEERTGKRRR